MKKNLKQTETGKKMFIKLMNLASKEGDIGLREFCKEVLGVYDKHNINSHIKWKLIDDAQPKPNRPKTYKTKSSN